jgi:hypothetical protein
LTTERSRETRNCTMATTTRVALEDLSNMFRN